MVLLFGDIYGSKVVILEEDTDVEVVLVLVFEKYVKEEVDESRELTDGWLEEFSEPWSEVCPCQSQGSQGD